MAADEPWDQFPRGKLRDDDEGELRVAVGVRDKTVVINFGKPVHWFGLDAHGARAFSKSIGAKADEVDPQIAQGTGIYFKTQLTDSDRSVGVEIETLTDEELISFFSDMEAGELCTWLVRVIGIVRENRRLVQLS